MVLKLSVRKGSIVSVVYLKLCRYLEESWANVLNESFQIGFLLFTCVKKSCGFAPDRNAVVDAGSGREIFSLYKYKNAEPESRSGRQ